MDLTKKTIGELRTLLGQIEVQLAEAEKLDTIYFVYYYNRDRLVPDKFFRTYNNAKDYIEKTRLASQVSWNEDSWKRGDWTYYISKQNVEP